MAEGLGGLALLFMLVSPLLSLALPLSNGSKLGWSLWVLSVIGVALHWRTYFNIGDIYYTVGDMIDYNEKKPEFALTVAISSWTLLSFFAYLVRRYTLFLDKKFERILLAPAILALSIVGYHATGRVMRDQNWGVGQCSVDSGAKGRMPCAQNGWGNNGH